MLRRFTSDEFHKAVIAAGIRQWRTGVAMPSQNGRIERLFGTLKEKLNQITPPDFAALNVRLDEFAFSRCCGRWSGQHWSGQQQ